MESMRTVLEQHHAKTCPCSACTRMTDGWTAQVHPCPTCVEQVTADLYRAVREGVTP